MWRVFHRDWRERSETADMQPNSALLTDTYLALRASFGGKTRR
jgi:hypothetical protein